MRKRTIGFILCVTVVITMVCPHTIFAAGVDKQGTESQPTAGFIQSIKDMSDPIYVGDVKNDPNTVVKFVIAPNAIKVGEGFIVFAKLAGKLSYNFSTPNSWEERYFYTEDFNTFKVLSIGFNSPLHLTSFAKWNGLYVKTAASGKITEISKDGYTWIYFINTFPWFSKDGSNIYLNTFVSGSSLAREAEGVEDNRPYYNPSFFAPIDDTYLDWTLTKVNKDDLIHMFEYEGALHNIGEEVRVADYVTLPKTIKVEAGPGSEEYLMIELIDTDFDQYNPYTGGTTISIGEDYYDFLINGDNKNGKNDSVSKATEPAKQKNDPVIIDKKTVTANSLNIRSEPSTNAKVISKYVKGDTAYIIEGGNGVWLKVLFNGKTGYIHSNYVK